MKASKKTLIVLIICGLFLVGFRFFQLKIDSSAKVDFVLSNFTNRIENAVNSAVSILHPLEVIILRDPKEFTQAEFDKLGHSFCTEGIHQNLSYLPNGVITYIYNKKEEHKVLIGKSVLVGEHASEHAIQAKNKKEVVFSVPWNNIVDGIGIVARKAIYHKNDFVGFVSVDLSPLGLVQNSSIAELKDIGYEYKLVVSYNNEKVMRIQSGKYIDAFAYRKDFNIGLIEWSLSIMQPYEFLNNFERVFSLFIASIAVIIFVYCMMVKMEKRKERAEYELYIDPLTKSYNRKMMDEYLNKSESGSFTIFYLDLNDFKPVNDTHGHDIGDKLLIAYVERLKANFKKNISVIRMGGDEFALIVEGDLTPIGKETIAKRIKSITVTPFGIDNLVVKISTSLGYASYPIDGDSISELLAKADSMMYQDKVQMKLKGNSD